MVTALALESTTGGEDAKTEKVRGGELEISEARKQEAAFYKAFKKKLVVI